MSSEAVNRPVIQDGFYEVKYGRHNVIGGSYMTAGPPHTRVTAEALRPQPFGKTQIFHFKYYPKKHKYSITTDARHGTHGVTYDKPMLHGHIVTSAGAPHLFNIVEVHAPTLPKAYRIFIGGGSTQELVIGIAPPKIHPPFLELQAVTLGAVWQLIRVHPHSRNEEAEAEPEQVEDEEQYSDEEYSDEE